MARNAVYVSFPIGRRYIYKYRCYIHWYMTTMKLSKSGNAVTIVDDQGNVYMAAVKAIQMLLNKQLNGGLLIMSRMPNKIPPGKFKISPLFDPLGLAEKGKTQEMGDPLNMDYKALEQKKKGYEDKNIW